jgi:hypothetical protein
MIVQSLGASAPKMLADVALDFPSIKGPINELCSPGVDSAMCHCEEASMNLIVNLRRSIGLAAAALALAGCAAMSPGAASLELRFNH